MKAILTNCVTGEVSNVEVDYTIESTKNGKIFRLIGGVTGFESFYIDNIILEKFKNDSGTSIGWVACVGTKGVYDRMIIPIAEMKKALNLSENK